MNIRKAEVKDVSDIIDIIKSVHIKNVKNRDNGFLSSKNISKRLYEKKVNQFDYCYVYELENKIVGFLLATSFDLIKENNGIYPFLLSKNKENFIYIFQVGVNPTYQKKGIATLLYERLFKDAKINNFSVISSKDPFNKASREFHLKLGFKDVDVFKWTDGTESFVYKKKIIK
ncbi:MAG: GNAT family N-acetyltransferase [Candidatus Pacebacteria bacterium]|nr:GNAT family N-acetyltransferase [Candidatus Paceibacterota bacterium]